jgi:small-conductance mechanosensitive channel
MEPVYQALIQLWPALTTLAGMALLLLAAKWVAARSETDSAGVGYSLFVLLVVSVAVITLVITLPISDETQGQVLSLLGVVLTAVIALSSTTFVANAMAGLMLRITQPFRVGDFLRVGEQFGRVSRRSLFHTQIQTETRDLATLPNLMLVTNPVTVLHREGTIISADISLGYDVPYTRVEELLLLAATEAGLEKPYVMIKELLDHAVVYMVAGFLGETRTLLSARSRLRAKALEQLHGHGVEIVSPTFMNQRQLDPAHKIIPEQPVLHQYTEPGAEEVREAAPEEKIFDKAEEAANLEEIRQQLGDTRLAMKHNRAQLKGADEETRGALERHARVLERQEAILQQLVEDAGGDSGKA